MRAESTNLPSVAALLLLVILAVVAAILYNSIVAARNDVGESFSAVDTVLQTRHDLVPNLVAVVRGYAAHESAVFARVAEARSSLAQNRGAGKDRFDGENELQGAVKSVFAIAEAYPDLKASANFLDLQERLTRIEERLQAARRAYNAAVKAFQNKRQMFPSSVVAGVMSLPHYAMFDAGREANSVPSASIA